MLALLLAASLAVSGDRFLAFVVGITMIYILWTAGMNLLTGYTGLVPLVYAGIAGVSAYATVALTMQHRWSFWLATPVSALLAALVGVLLGLPSLRLKGFYFALSSLVIQTVVSLTFVYFVGFTNGDTGIDQIPPPDMPFSNHPLRGLAFDLSACGFCLGRRHWHLGDYADAIRSAARRNPGGRTSRQSDRHRCLRDKMLSFFIGSFYAGIGGSLYAGYVGFISPRNFDLLTSLNIWLMVAFGGRGTIMGPIIGAAVLAPVPFLLQQYASLKDVIYGALVIVVMVLMPMGLYGGLLRHIRLSPGAVWLRTILLGRA